VERAVRYAVLWSIKEENLSMNKKLMALAVAGALAPATALAQNYSVYGRLTLGVDTYEAKGSTDLTAAANSVPANDYLKRSRVFDNGSRVGFRGTEDLGGGVRAEFLIETGVNVDNGSTTGQGGQANSSSGVWGSRIGHVGLSGSAGLITWGRSNVYWTNGTIEQVGANWLNIGCQVCTGTFGRGMGVGVTRVSNTMQYTSPTWAGFNFVASYSPSRQEAQPQGTNVDAKAYGLTLQGTHGPFAWGVDFGQDTGNTPNQVAGVNPPQGENQALKLRAAFKYVPAGQVSAMLITNKSTAGGPTNAGGSATGLPANCNTTATNCEFKQQGMAFGWDHMFGPWHPILWVASVGDITGSGCDAVINGAPAGGLGGAPAGEQCKKTSSTQITAAIRYIFSKRTHAYVSYNKMDNDQRYNHDFLGASMTSRAAASNQSTGADPTVIAAGVIHNF
jgi:predicted porin